MKRICQVEELAQKKAIEFVISVQGRELDAFAVYHQGEVFAYYNRCPHTGVSLNWVPGQFYDVTENLIQCSVHGALFQPGDGLCVHGPCTGQSLQPVIVQCEQGWVVTQSSE